MKIVCDCGREITRFEGVGEHKSLTFQPSVGSSIVMTCHECNKTVKITAVDQVSLSTPQHLSYYRIGQSVEIVGSKMKYKDAYKGQKYQVREVRMTEFGISYMLASPPGGVNPHEWAHEELTNIYGFTKTMLYGSSKGMTKND